MPTSIHSSESTIEDISRNSIHRWDRYILLVRWETLCRLQALKGSASEPLNGKSYKPLAEQGVQAIQRYILTHFRHQKIFSVDEANDKVSEILDKYNHKIMKHTGKSRTQLFEELDKPELRALPANRYIYEQFKIARVNMDYHIILKKCNYSVPFKYLKDQVEVRYSTQHVRIYFKMRSLPHIQG